MVEVIALVSCTKLKLQEACTAEKDVFKKCPIQEVLGIRTCQCPKNIHPVREIWPSISRNRDRTVQRDPEWCTQEAERGMGTRVIEQIGNNQEFNDVKKVLFLCGSAYSSTLKRFFTEKGVEVVDPLEGKGIGERLSWLSIF